MNEKLLLINVITVMYRYSQLNDNTVKPTKLLQDVCNTVKTRAIGMTPDRESKMIHDLKLLAIKMVTSSDNEEYNLSDLLQKVQVITEPDPNLFEAFRDNIIVDLDPVDIKKYCMRIISEFKKFFKEQEAKEIINRYAFTAKFKPEEVGDISKFIAQMVSELEPYRSVDMEKDPAILKDVNFDSVDSIVKAFEEVKELQSGDGMFRTGWQCINRMVEGGFRPGDNVVIGALQHRNKSGFTKTLFKQFCLYNTPHLIDPSKKPLMIHISFEDEVPSTMEFMYKSLRENEENIFVSKEMMRNIPPAELAKYVKSRLEATGFHIQFYRVNPSDWYYMDILNLIIKQETLGYEVKAVVCDYLGLLPTKGCTQGPNGVDLRDLFRRIRNFTSSRKILFITPHQLSTEAKLLDRDDTIDFVKKIANGGYYAGSRQIDQEVDIEIYLHFEDVNGRRYQTIQRGKRRGNEITPEKDKYCVLPFSDIGGLRDDINGPDSSVSKPGAISKAQQDAGEEQPFWLGEN